MSVHANAKKRFARAILCAAGIGMLFMTTMVSAKPAGVKAKFDATNPAMPMLTVKAKSKDAEVVLYDDVLDQELARQSPLNGQVNFMIHGLPTTPCRVRVESGGKALVANTAGLNCKGVKKPMVCAITMPVGNQTIANGATLNFSGSVKGAKSRSLNYEWDFGGAADARVTQVAASSPQSSTGPVEFGASKDTKVWVTFTAQDITGARCADRLEVTVGNPPAAARLPATTVSEQTAMAGDPNYVVIPFQPVGMAFHDLSYGYYSMLVPSNWLNAIVIKRGGGQVSSNAPKLQTPEEVTLAYSAASSDFDPVSPGSINSTSRNYPLASTIGDATVRKSDWFDPCQVWKNPAVNDINASDTQFVSFFDTYLNQKPYQNRSVQPRPGTGVVNDVDGNMTNAECNFSNFFVPNWSSDPWVHRYNDNDPLSWAYLNLTPDAGAAFWTYDLISRFDYPRRPADPDFPGFRGVMPPNGSAMPGKDDPYVANDPQGFFGTEMPEAGDNYPGFDALRNMFAAVGFPQFPTDDKGRHNAYPLMRVQAKDHGGQLLGTTDAVTAVTTEFKCAECHTKGKNGADQSIYDGLKADMEKFKDSDASNDVAQLEGFKGREKWIPQFVSPTDVDPMRPMDRDVIEQASMINIARLHDFYYNFIDDSQWLGPLEFESEQVYGEPGQVKVQPGNCTDYCHKSVPRADPRRYNMAPVFDAAEGAGGACPEMSDSLHNIHGRLTGRMEADYTGTIDRDPYTRELKLADLSKISTASPPQFLLNVKDAGTPDNSCFYCHAGKQDKYQRDVMSGVGVNCIDCHGDLAVLAGGGAMVSRDKGSNPLSSRDGPGDLTVAIGETREQKLDNLAEAYMAERSSYAPEADGSWYFMVKGQDGVYRRNGNVVSTLTMVMNFMSDSVTDNGDGSFTYKDDGGNSQTSADTDVLLDLKDLRVAVNGWNLHFARIPWAEQPSCANCHTGNGDEPVRRRAYDMTTGQFRFNAILNERFAENMLPKKHDSSFTHMVQDTATTGETCPPGTFSDTVSSTGNFECARGLFKDSVDRHAKVPCEACHGPTHGVWPNPDPYANDNVTAMQLQGHTGTILECEVCHQKDGSKDVYFPENVTEEHTLHQLLIKGPHDMHPVNDPRFILNDKANDKPAHQVSHGDLAKHNNSARDAWEKAGRQGNNPDICAACHGEDHRGNRLAKTPIDRVLTVSDPTKLKPSIKAKKSVSVKKGDIIGCDLCHSLETSFSLAQ